MDKIKTQHGKIESDRKIHPFGTKLRPSSFVVVIVVVVSPFIMK